MPPYNVWFASERVLPLARPSTRAAALKTLLPARSHDSRYSPIAQRDKRHSQAIPTKVSISASPKAARAPGAPRPRREPARPRSSAPARRSGAETTARFQIPIVVAIAPGGKRGRRSPSPRRGRRPIRGPPRRVAANDPRAEHATPMKIAERQMTAAPPTFATSRLSRRSLGRAARRGAEAPPPP